MKPHPFIGSSTSGLSVVSVIRQMLKDICEIHSWPGSFDDPGRAYKEVLLGELQKCQIAAFVVTPDDRLESPRKAGGSGQVGRDNVIFEAGLAVGRYGFERTIILAESSVDLPTDWDGLTHIRFTLDSPDLATILAEPANKLRRAIERQSAALLDECEKQQKAQYWYLTMLRVKPGYQVDVKNAIELNAEIIARDPKVSVGQVGVLFGEYDDFLIFGAPSIDAATDFVSRLRWKITNITQADTRQIFPGFYWTGPDTNAQSPRVEHLMLINCTPHLVEDVYDKLRKLLPDPACDFVITKLGIIFGRHDIFLVVSTPHIDAFDRFVTETLRESQILSHLTDNTTSLRIGR